MFAMQGELKVTSVIAGFKAQFGGVCANKFENPHGTQKPFYDKIMALKSEISDKQLKQVSDLICAYEK